MLNHDDISTPEVVPWEFRANSGPVLSHENDAIPEAVRWEYKENGIHTVGTGIKLGTTPTPQPLRASKFTKRKCGLPIRLFYGVIALVALLIVGGIAGGVAAGLQLAPKSRDDQNPITKPNDADPITKPSDANPITKPNDANPITKINAHVLATSRLSATNWTNPLDGTLHRFVVFQDPFNAVIARRWNSENRTWTTNNLTDIFSQTRHPVNVLTPSTSLASASCSWPDRNELHIYFVAPDNTIAGASILDLLNEPNNWTYDNLEGGNFVTFPGSQIAAAWQRGYTSDTVGWWALAWQQNDGAVWLANATDFGSPQVAIQFQDIVHSTSLALIPELKFTSGTLSRLTMMSEFLSSPTTGIVKKFTYDGSFWFFGKDGHWLDDKTIPPPTTGLQFALTRFDNFTTVYFLALLPNGTITGEYWADGYKQVPTVTFIDGPPNVNFTAIAATEENMVYGISGDSVLQYSVKGSDPSVFHFEGVVFP
ncbi:hypothetical protein HD806DRAFT_518178 [Xylariaceae sp. AK1471]|nr:hypothetical protein HD806DRAFT_518178 [Xylariaceae sp. AK1471]